MKITYWLRRRAVAVGAVDDLIGRLQAQHMDEEDESMLD